MLFNLHHKAIGLLTLTIVFVGAFALPLPAFADHCDPSTQQTLSIAIQDPSDPTGQTMIHCIDKYGAAAPLARNPIIGFLKTVIQFLAVGIGIVLVIGLVVGGITYETARANPQQLQKAEEFIRNDIIAIGLFVFMFATLNFLIPGGILN